jgi:uncharacterized linocin/CFP29 family protein
MGMVKVGSVAKEHVDGFTKVTTSVAVTVGNTSWNCQDWIIEALSILKSKGYDVVACSKEALANALAVATRK